MYDFFSFGIKFFSGICVQLLNLASFFVQDASLPPKWKAFQTIIFREKVLFYLNSWSVLKMLLSVFSLFCGDQISICNIFVVIILLKFKRKFKHSPGRLGLVDGYLFWGRIWKFQYVWKSQSIQVLNCKLRTIKEKMYYPHGPPSLSPSPNPAPWTYGACTNSSLRQVCQFINIGNSLIILNLGTSAKISFLW